MLYELNQLSELCSDFINEIDDFEVAMSTDFECIPTTNEIFISIFVPTDGINMFRDNLITRTDIDDISEFTWSLMHEVGHCMTWNYINKRTKHHCRNTKRKIARGTLPKPLYFDLADEKTATDWAIGYITNNHNAVKAFDNQVLQLLTEIFEQIED